MGTRFALERVHEEMSMLTVGSGGVAFTIGLTNEDVEKLKEAIKNAT